MSQKIVRTVILCPLCKKHFTIVHPLTISINSWSCLTCERLSTTSESEKSKSGSDSSEVKKKDKDSKGK